MKVSFRHFLHCLDLDLESFEARSELTAFRISALRDAVVKKYVDQKSEKADSIALERFVASNFACSLWSLESSSLMDDHLIGEFRDELYRFWWRTYKDGLIPSMSGVFQYGRTGPGSSIGANGTDYYSKLFSSTLTSTSRYLYDEYRRNADRLPIFRHAEMARASDYGELRVVEGNRLSFVPKTNDVSRTICTEPTLNMFFQMGIGEYLTRRLKQFYGIDLSTQPDRNRELALRGSVYGDLSTIDLSSASDSVSQLMLKEFLPRDWYNYLQLARSPYCTLPNGRTLELHMVSSMGNAFTFPLQTIIFRAVLSAAVRVDGRRIKRSDLAVFGDDIICPVSISGKVIRLLNILGFAVNKDKTFVEGPFRESCGHDYLNGHDVRPVYIKSLSTQQDRYIAINLLNAWSTKSGVPLASTVRYLCDTVTWNLVPPSESLDSGILAPSGFLTKTRRDSNASIKYRAFRARPVLLRVDPKTLHISGYKSRKLSRNPAGLLESFLRGYIRDHVIPVRSDWVTYSSKWCVTPNWDYIPAASALGSVLNYLKFDVVKRQWNTAVYLNLFR